MTGANKIRVAVLSDLPYPHWIRLWSRLATSEQIDLTVYICAKPLRNRPWNVDLRNLPFRCECLRGISVPLHWFAPDVWHAHINPGILRELFRDDHDMFLTVGWTYPTMLAVLTLRKWHRKPVLLWDEAIPHPPPRLKRILAPLIRRILSSYDGYLTAGPRTPEYLSSYGADPRKIYVVGQAALDKDDFENKVAEVSQDRQEIKERVLGAIDKKVLLFSGQLIHRKGVHILLEAYREVQEAYPDVALIMMGNGPLRSQLEGYVRANGLRNVIFAGFLSPEQFIEFYAIADVFVLPSLYDCFPIVICEAMCSGLPVVTTSQVGSAGNLVREGENGFVVRPGDSSRLAAAILRMLRDDTLRQQMGMRARAAVQCCSIESVAGRMLDAFNSIAAGCETSDAPLAVNASERPDS